MGYRRRAAMLASAIVTTVACGASASEPPKPKPKPVDRVVALAQGKCVVVYAEDCPTDAPCAPESYGKESIPCPPALEAGKGALRLSHHKGECSVWYEVECPPDATCNPPPPEDIDCPERFRPQPRVTIDRREDGTCYEVVSMDCPPEVLCNPPPPREVKCPPEEPKPAPSE